MSSLNPNEFISAITWTRGLSMTSLHPTWTDDIRWGLRHVESIKKMEITLMATLLSLVALDVVLMTISSARRPDKVGILIILSFQCITLFYQRTESSSCWLIFHCRPPAEDSCETVGFVTHICITMEIGAVFHGAYMWHEAKACCYAGQRSRSINP